MAALTVNKDRGISGGIRRRHYLEASANPYVGSFASFAVDGYIHELVAGERFAGVFDEQVLDKNKPAADGDILVGVRQGSFLAHLTVSGAAQDDVAHRRWVYASDDNTFTFTAANNTPIGQIVGLDGSDAIVLCLADEDMGGVLSKTAAYTMRAHDAGKTLYGDTSGGAFTVTLAPAADWTGKRCTFVRTGSGANALTLDGDGSETIDGSATYAALDAQFDTVTLESDGSNALIVASKVA